LIAKYSCNLGNRTRDGKGRLPLLYGGDGGAEAFPRAHEEASEIPRPPATLCVALRTGGVTKKESRGRFFFVY